MWYELKILHQIRKGTSFLIDKLICTQLGSSGSLWSSPTQRTVWQLLQNRREPHNFSSYGQYIEVEIGARRSYNPLLVRLFGIMRQGGN